jgi:hypothetical protein
MRSFLIRGKQMAEGNLDGQTEPASRDQVFLKQMELFLEIYRHHLELLIKAVVVYLAIVGAAAGYVFREGTTPGSKAALSMVVAILSMVALVGCHWAVGWVKGFNGTVDRIADRLAAERFSFSGLSMMLRIVECLCGVIAAACIVNTWAALR